MQSVNYRGAADLPGAAPLYSPFRSVCRPACLQEEADTDGVMFKAYNARFWTPATIARGPNNGTWYSWNAGMIHWVQVAGYESFAKGSPQQEWLIADLEAVDRTKTPWVVVTFHEPYMNSNYGACQRVMCDIGELTIHNIVYFSSRRPILLHDLIVSSLQPTRARRTPCRRRWRTSSTSTTWTCASLATVSGSCAGCVLRCCRVLLLACRF